MLLKEEMQYIILRFMEMKNVQEIIKGKETCPDI